VSVIKDSNKLVVVLFLVRVLRSNLGTDSSVLPSHGTKFIESQVNVYMITSKLMTVQYCTVLTVSCSVH